MGAVSFLAKFLATLGIAYGVLWAAANIVINSIANILLAGIGYLLVGLDIFALIVWLVNWKYYPQTHK